MRNGKMQKITYICLSIDYSESSYIYGTLTIYMKCTYDRSFQAPDFCLYFDTREECDWQLSQYEKI